MNDITKIKNVIFRRMREVGNKIEKFKNKKGEKGVYYYSYLAKMGELDYLLERVSGIEKGKVRLTCEKCGKPFEIDEKDYKEGQKQYCRWCYDNHT